LVASKGIHDEGRGQDWRVENGEKRESCVFGKQDVNDLTKPAEKKYKEGRKLEKKCLTKP